MTQPERRTIRPGLLMPKARLSDVNETEQARAKAKPADRPLDPDIHKP